MILPHLGERLKRKAFPPHLKPVHRSWWRNASHIFLLFPKCGADASANNWPKFHFCSCIGATLDARSHL